MANQKFSTLPVASVLNQSDIFAVTQAGTSKSSIIGNLWEPTAVGNANYTILATDVYVYTSIAFTAPRAWTLPSAASYGPGRLLRVVDVLGTLTSTNTLTITRAGTDTINGLTTKVLLNAYQSVLLACDGVSLWSVVAVGVIPVFVQSGANHAIGLVPDPGASAGTTKFLREDATWVAPSSGLADPGANGVIKRTSLNVTAQAVAKTDYWDTTDFVQSGGSHAHGLVPDPGASAGTTKFLCEDATWKAPSAGLLAFAGSLTSVTTINATTTDTTGGVTLASQTAASGTLWRIKSHGQYSAVSNATARNMLITAYWGSTALVQLSIAVTVSQTATFIFELECLLNGTSTTAIWESGYTSMLNASSVKSARLTPASTTVTSGAQTIDLRFSMSTASSSDSWSIDGVTIERLK